MICITCSIQLRIIGTLTRQSCMYCGAIHSRPATGDNSDVQVRQPAPVDRAPHLEAKLRKAIKHTQ